LLGDVAGKQVIDLCAAPGGKTAALAGRGAQVIAVDRSENRLTRLEENLSRLNVKAEVVCADAVQWRPAEPAHAVLVDAPCSATGTIRRHPDIPRLKSEADVDKLVVLQEKLLAAAVDMVRPGGVIVYCTCSLQPEEGPAQVAKFLAERPVVKLDRIAASEVADLSELITPDGVFRSLPCHLSDLGGIDGFYAARLRKQ
jgi:16S rRNA (cytosine967-C5)-methyltransferase